jgi:hypothetical protein
LVSASEVKKKYIYRLKVSEKKELRRTFGEYLNEVIQDYRAY